MRSQIFSKIFPHHRFATGSIADSRTAKFISRFGQAQSGLCGTGDSRAAKFILRFGRAQSELCGTSVSTFDTSLDVEPNLFRIFPA